MPIDFAANCTQLVSPMVGANDTSRFNKSGEVLPAHQSAWSLGDIDPTG
jgi:hypothetical protein